MSDLQILTATGAYIFGCLSGHVVVTFIKNEAAKIHAKLDTFYKDVFTKLEATDKAVAERFDGVEQKADTLINKEAVSVFKRS